MFECEFCKKTFTTKSSLVLHKKTTKRCLKIQNEKLSVEIESVKYACKYCDKEFLLKHRIEEHEQNCKNRDNFTCSQLKLQMEQMKKDFELLREKYEKQVVELAECRAIINCEGKHLEESRKLVDKLTDKTSVVNNNKTITNNNIINIVNTDEFKNLPEFTKENVCKEFKKHMTPNVFLKGEDGVIESMSNTFHVFVITTDASRMKGIIKDENSKVRKTTGIKMVKKGLSYISDANKDIIKKVPEIMPEYSVSTYETVGQAHVAMNMMRESIQNSEDDRTDKMIEQIAKKTIREGVTLN